MAVSFRSPPSARDFDVHRSVNFEGLSTWQAASKFAVSQTRVRQILRRVADWLAEALPPQMEAEAAARLRYAEHVASDRLQHHYSESMEQWRRTQQPRYLYQAMRVALAAGKLAAPAWHLESLVAGETEEPWEEDASSARGNAPSTELKAEAPRPCPPARDFSASGEPDDESPAPAAKENGASRCKRSLLELLTGGPAGATGALSERTRSLLTPAEGSDAIAQICLSPHQPGATIERPGSPERALTRQERRRLQKKLKRAKGLR